MPSPPLRARDRPGLNPGAPQQRSALLIGYRPLAIKHPSRRGACGIITDRDRADVALTASVRGLSPLEVDLIGGLGAFAVPASG